MTIVGMVSAFLISWYWSGFYEYMPDEKFLIEPYLATVLVSLPSAMITLFSMFLFSHMEDENKILSRDFDFINSIAGSIFLGFYGAFIMSPVSLIAGSFLGWYLIRKQKNQLKINND